MGETVATKSKWTFIRKIRWAVNFVFIAFMLFVSVSLAVGIATNLHWRYDDLDLPIDRPASLSDFSPLQMRDCLTALEQMHAELWDRAQQALRGDEERDALLASWGRWSQGWREQLERLGMSCGLTEYRYDHNPTLGLMSEIYNLLDYFQRHHTRMVKRFVTENARPLRNLRGLFARVRESIERIEGEPVESGM